MYPLWMLRPIIRRKRSHLVTLCPVSIIRTLQRQIQPHHPARPVRVLSSGQLPIRPTVIASSAGSRCLPSFLSPFLPPPTVCVPLVFCAVAAVAAAPPPPPPLLVCAPTLLAVACPTALPSTPSQSLARVCRRCKPTLLAPAAITSPPTSPQVQGFAASLATAHRPTPHSSSGRLLPSSKYKPPRLNLPSASLSIRHYCACAASSLSPTAGASSWLDLACNRQPPRPSAPSRCDSANNTLKLGACALLSPVPCSSLLFAASHRHPLPWVAEKSKSGPSKMTATAQCGLFKKAHELSVLCSVDVAVFIFGNNKKLYEYSSADMHDLITRHQYHGGPNEHKGPTDFAGADDGDEDEDGDATPPRGHEEAQMMPPQYHPQHGHFPPQIRHHTASASPPVPNGGPFPGHHAHHLPPRGHSPHPPMGRPDARNDGRRVSSSMIPPPAPGPHPGITYMPAPPIYNGPTAPSQPMMHSHGAQYYSAQPQHPHQPPPPQAYADDRRPPQPHSQQSHSQQSHSQQSHSQQSHSQQSHSQQPHSQQPHHQQSHPQQSHSQQSHPQQPHAQQPHPGYTPQPPPQQTQAPFPPQPSSQAMSMPPRPDIQQPTTMPHPPPPDRRPMESQPPHLREVALEMDARHPPSLNTDSAIKKLPQRRSHSIFTPVEENRSILGQHSKLFSTEESTIKEEPTSRSQSVDAGAPMRTSPPLPRSHSSMDKSRNVSLPDVTFAPPSRTNSVTGGPLSARPRGPKLTVQIPDGGSEQSGSAVTAESSSPRNPADTPTHTQRRHGSIVLPPPSPSTSALLSAGATGPPNPFARPPPVNPQGIGNGVPTKNDTPQSALPSRYLNGDFLPSPSSFYPEWNYKASDSNTLPSPLNFSTPVVGSGPSFLTQDQSHTAMSSASTATSSSMTAIASAPDSLKSREAMKRKSEGSATSSTSSHGPPTEAKRVKVE
ncbi:SRF-type transcription factor RlmA [Cordyceps militaris CM01]|uniref:SRF-type transcription factor RlmA n=1 Tax=Cordyceps militaris (strain CM01) TaxID=983644 RepID=G3JQY3_CORMM|nr:SRF-type transcription factor RlmA [Cordyceps militaris CM01]EGX89427.1 SRF-type transcription factor RlmA [Cordyceps militaris CM01]